MITQHFENSSDHQLLQASGDIMPKYTIGKNFAYL